MATVDDATRNMIRNLEDKTGRSLADWAALARGSGHEKHGRIVAWLKGEHGLGHGYANLVALESRGGLTLDAPADDGLAAVFAGDKATLRPLYDAIEAYVNPLARSRSRQRRPTSPCGARSSSPWPSPRRRPGWTSACSSRASPRPGNWRRRGPGTAWSATASGLRPRPTSTPR